METGATMRGGSRTLRSVSHLAIVLLSLPPGVLLAAFLYPDDAFIRDRMHLLSYGTSFATYLIWLYLHIGNRRAVVLAIFAGFGIRMTLFILTGIVLLIFFPELLRPGLVTYALSACFFLFFEIFALSTLQLKPVIKIENK